MEAYEHAQTEPQVTDLHGHLVTRGVDENRPHHEIARLRHSNTLGVNTPETVSATRPPFNSITASRLEGRPVIRFPKQLQLHPALNGVGWTGVIDEINNAARVKDQSVSEPILITTNGTILAGFGYWRLAVSESRREIRCIEYPLSEHDALQFILAHHQTRRGWNAFVRIGLALSLEPYFQQQALDNMRAGGKYKGSSDLTEAGKVDVRAEIAAAAGVSAGNVTKVKQLMRSATVEVLQALRFGEISIHRAWQWSRLPAQQQLTQLEKYRNSKGTNQTSRRLIQKHVARLSPAQLVPPNLGDLLGPFIPDRSAQLNSIAVTEIDAPGSIAYLTKDALRTLRSMEKSKWETGTC